MNKYDFTAFTPLENYRNYDFLNRFRETMESKYIDKRILEGAMSLYSKYGIRSITMEDLCRELGISKKTVYQQISDKSELVQQVVDYDISIQKNELENLELANLNAIDELIHVNKRIHRNQGLHNPTFYFDLKKYYKPIYQNWFSYKRSRMYELILRNLKKGIREGLYRQEMDPEIISKLHMMRTETLHSSDIFDSDEARSSSFIDEIFTFHIHGICNEKGLAYYKSQTKKLTIND